MDKRTTGKIWKVHTGRWYGLLRGVHDPSDGWGTGKILCGESGVYVRISHQPWHDISVKGSHVQRIDEKDQEIWNGSRIKRLLTAFILCHRDGLFWGSKETGDRNIVSINSGSSWMIYSAVWIIARISITSRIYAGMGRQSSQQECCHVKCK